MKTLSVRITQDLFDQLVKAAASNNCRSLSQHVERTLARSIPPTAPTEGKKLPRLTNSRSRRRGYARPFQPDHRHR